MTDPTIPEVVARVQDMTADVPDESVLLCDEPSGLTEWSLCVGDLRALLAHLDALTAERDELAMWLRESEVGARETQTQHEMQLATLREQSEDAHIAAARCRDLHGDYHTLRERLARAEADSARIDALQAWMRKGDDKGVEMWRIGKSWGVELTEHDGATNVRVAVTEQDLRAALDAARRAPDTEDGT